MKRALADPLLCLLLVSLTLLVASLTYWYIEVPARKALNRRFQSPTKVTA